MNRRMMLLPALVLALILSMPASAAFAAQEESAQVALGADVMPDAVVVLEGEGPGEWTVTIPEAPLRVLLTAEDGLARLSLYQGDFVRHYGTKSQRYGVIDKAGDYTVTSESDGKWSFRAEPIGEGGVMAIQGTGSYVGPFFNVTDYTQVQLTFTVHTLESDSPGFSADLYHQYRYTEDWEYDTMQFFDLVEGETRTYERQIAPVKGRDQFFWAIICDPDIDWEIVVLE